MWSKWSFYKLLVGVVLHWSTERQFLIKLNIYLLYDSAVLLFGYLPKRNENIYPQKDLNRRFIAALFKIDPKLEITQMFINRRMD